MRVGTACPTISEKRQANLSVNLEILSFLVPNEINAALEEMPSGTHAVLVYDSTENKREVLFRHLKLGMRTEGLIYACSEEAPQEIRQGLESSGVDVGSLEANGMLMVKNYDEVYIVNGRVDSPKIVDGFSKLAWSYARNGMEGVRAAGEMSCFLREQKVSELLQYERALHQKFSFPGKGICAYNLVEMDTSGNLDALWPVLKAHSLVIMTGPRGSFALKPEEIKESDLEAALSVSALVPITWRVLLRRMDPSIPLFRSALCPRATFPVLRLKGLRILQLRQLQLSPTKPKLRRSCADTWWVGVIGSRNRRR